MSQDSGAEDDRLEQLIDDLEDATAVAEQIVERGKQAYDEDAVSRYAATMVLVRLRAIAERLGDDAERLFPSHDWAGLRGQRNLIVHRYPVVDHDMIWNSLVRQVVDLRAQVLQLRASPGPATADTDFPGSGSPGTG